MPKKSRKSVPAARSQRHTHASYLGAIDDMVLLGRDIRHIELLRANAAQAIAAIEEKCLKETESLKASAAERAQRLHDHAKKKISARDDDVKHVAIGIGVVAWALSPPAVKLEKPEEVIDWLIANKREEFIRRPAPQINRKAMLDDSDAAKEVPGVSIEQAHKVAVRPGNMNVRVEATLGKSGRPGKWKIVWPEDETATD